MAQDVSQDLALHKLIGRDKEVLVSWERPSEWPDIDSLVGPTDNKFVGLYAVSTNVNPSDGQPVVLTVNASSGTFSVNWGDGTSSTGVSVGTWVGRKYDPTNVNLINTSYSYKIAIITITWTPGSISNINLKPTKAQAETALPSATFAPIPSIAFPWLDINFRASGITHTTQAFANLFMLHRIKIRGSYALGINAGLSYFFGCRSLREVDVEPSFTQYVTTAQSMFQDCESLVKVPDLDTSSVTTMTSMFRGCRSLAVVPHFDTSSVTTMRSMFQGCISLQEVPHFDTSNVGTFGHQSDADSGMFNGCTSLVWVPTFNLASAAQGNATRNMFKNCHSLLQVPSFPLPTPRNPPTADNDTFSGLFNCTRIRFHYWPDSNINLADSSNLGPEALNEIFTNLPSSFNGSTITITNTRGAATCNPTIATAKSWTVVT
jgi:surface protein